MYSQTFYLYRGTAHISEILYVKNMHDSMQHHDERNQHQKQAQTLLEVD